MSDRDSAGDIDSVRSSYEVASNLWVVETQTYWSKISAFLIANGFLLSAIGVTEAQKDATCFTRIALPFVGASISFIWLLMSIRSYKFADYFHYSAINLEQKCPLTPGKIFSQAEELAENGKVPLFLYGKEREFRIPVWGRISVEITSYILIWIFLAVYTALLAVNTIKELGCDSIYCKILPGVIALGVLFFVLGIIVYVRKKRFIPKED